MKEINERKITVEIADYTGHSVVLLNREEVLDMVSQTDSWIYSGGRRTNSQELAQSDWDGIVTISIMPQIQYG
jgi:hypothetical protein